MMNKASAPDSLWRQAWRVWRDDRGNTIVEFAVVIIIILTFLFGIMDFARFVYTYHFVSEVAREATRYSVVRGSKYAGVACTAAVPFDCEVMATSGYVTPYVQSITPPGINSTNLAVTTTWPSITPDGTTTLCTAPNPIDSPGCYVKVTLTYPFHFMLPFLPASTKTYTITSTSEMVIDQ